jgi:hypothetical protein
LSRGCVRYALRAGALKRRETPGPHRFGMPPLFKGVIHRSQRRVALACSITRSPAVVVRARYPVEYFPGPKHYPRLLRADRLLLVRRTRSRLSAHTTTTGRSLPVDGTGRLLGAQCAIGVVCLHPGWTTAAIRSGPARDTPCSSGSYTLRRPRRPNKHRHHSISAQMRNLASMTRLFAVSCRVAQMCLDHKLLGKY